MKGAGDENERKVMELSSSRLREHVWLFRKWASRAFLVRSAIAVAFINHVRHLLCGHSFLFRQSTGVLEMMDRYDKDFLEHIAMLQREQATQTIKLLEEIKLLLAQLVARTPDKVGY